MPEDVLRTNRGPYCTIALVGTGGSCLTDDHFQYHCSNRRMGEGIWSYHVRHGHFFAQCRSCGCLSSLPLKLPQTVTVEALTELHLEIVQRMIKNSGGLRDQTGAKR
jgi:hypothetical protein